MNIQISDLEFAYPGGLLVLRGISLEIPAGSQIALLGQNGAGKTTLVKQLNGLLTPTRGSVHIGDWNTREHSIAQLAQRVGYVFQNPDDQLFLTKVEDEVSFGPKNLKLDAAEVSARVNRAVELCALDKLRAEHPYDLQPWQRRWVAIASVIAMQTPIVVLDEPTTGQDEFGLTLLASLLSEWQRVGVTVIAVTHDVDYAVEHFAQIILMAQGQIIARGDASLFSDEPLLAQAALDAPQLVRLARALGWSEYPFKVDAFVAQYTLAVQNPQAQQAG